MNTQRYQLRLSGLPEPTGQIKASSLSRILDALLQMGERATRLIVTGQSSGKGRKPNTQVSERLRSIPPPKSYIVSGTLDEIKYGGGRFRLLLGRSDQLLGKLHPDLLDTEVLRPLWGNPTTVEGLVHFKANGQARWIEARRMSGRAEGDRVFEVIPSAEGEKALHSVPAPRKRRVRITDPILLAGSWPGDESIDELLAQLD